MVKYQLAQINISHAQSAMDSKVMQGFVDRLDEINALAEISVGFVWRLQADEGDASAIEVFEDPAIIINMSVWENIETLKNFVYQSVHSELMRDRDAWFNKMSHAQQALWWVPTGHTPSTEEGKARLVYLQEHGVTEHAFTFAKAFAAPERL